jgi:drug/metabolite transporter (DMT)-like permease
MAEPPKRDAWPQVRRALIIFALLAGGIGVFSILGGRQGDFEAGLPGAIVGASAAAVVVVVELIGRRLTRKPPGADGKGGVETETQIGTL